MCIRDRNKARLENMERLFVEYIASGRLQGGKLPTPGYMAGELDLSVAYFNDPVSYTHLDVYKRQA